MPSKSESTPSREPTLKDIEKHLKWQDSQREAGQCVTLSIFGTSVALVGFSLVNYFLMAMGGGAAIWGIVRLYKERSKSTTEN